MKLGLSSYSFYPLIQNGSIEVEDIFRWVKAQEGEHVEIAAFTLAPPGSDANHELGKDAEMVERIEASVRETGVVVSGICIGANFIDIDPAERREQIERVKRYVELCDRFGARFLRHDVVTWSRRLKDIPEFEREFAGISEACQEIATFAGRYGVMTSVEDHGFFMNSSERIRRLMHAVGLPNFRLTVDVGNFLCVDEDPLVATRACLPHASFVHLKDFYVRRTCPGPGWLETVGGQFIRGSIFGFGDLDARALLKSVVDSGFDGFVSLEYEGGEPAPAACETGFANIRRLLGEIRG
jgi:Sugar phosphate isomerases/epimerases